MFVTTGTTNSLSSDITTYDAFVNADAAGASYNGTTISWLAIGSTASVDAITHIGVFGDAIYLVDGTNVTPTDSSSGLWSGSLLHAPNEHLDGSNANAYLWTGAQSDGHTYTYPGYTYGLGSGFASIGRSSFLSSAWTFIDLGGTPEIPLALYGISGDLVVPGAAVPEPSTAILAGLGGVFGIAVRAGRRRTTSVT